MISTPNQSYARILVTSFAVAMMVCLAATPGTAANSSDWRYGLSQTSVFSMESDRSGNVWVATEDGLNRFDGSSLRIFRNDPSDPRSLPENLVRAASRDRRGRVWFATEGGGVAAWNPRSQAFRTFDRASGLSSNYARAIHTDRLGYVWVAARDAGLDRLDPESGLVTHFRHDPAVPGSLSDNNAYAIHESPDGTIWVGTNAGLDRYDPATGTFASVLRGTVKRPMQVRAIAQAGRGPLWIGTRGSGLARYNIVNNRTRRFRNITGHPGSLISNDVQTLFFDSKGTLWIGTVKGLDRFDRKAKTFVHTQISGGSGSILSVFEDARGSLWVGTELGGIASVNPASGKQKGAAQIGQADIVTAFAEDDLGRLYVGTVGEGLARIDRQTGSEKRFKNDPGKADSLTDDRVMALHRDSGGTLWIGTQRGGLNRLDSGSDSFASYRHDPSDPSSLSADGVVAFHEEADGTLWVATYGGGLNRLNTAAGTFTSYRHDPQNPSTLSSDRITSVIAAGSGQLWIGTDGGGLNLFDPATGTARSFAHDPLDPTTLPADTVCGLYVDGAGTLWIGTRGGGLARMDGAPTDTSEPIFTSFNESDGLPNGVVYGIQPDNYGNLWLSTNLGLSSFDPSSQTFTNFDAGDGLQGNEFNLGAAYRNANGELFFGGVNGFDAFYPEDMAGAQAPQQAASSRQGPTRTRSRRAGSSAPRMAGR